MRLPCELVLGHALEEPARDHHLAIEPEAAHPPSSWSDGSAPEIDLGHLFGGRRSVEERIPLKPKMLAVTFDGN
jgi:hypothetical protein